MHKDDYIFGGAAFVLAALALVATLAGQGTVAAKVVMWSIACGAAAAWGLLYFHRKRSAQRLEEKTTFITKHGLRVFAGGYEVSKIEIERLVDGYINKNIDSIGYEKLTLTDREGRPKIFIGLIVEFMPLPFTSDLRPDVPKLAGLAMLGRNKCLVGWHEDLTKTALIHELDHFVRGPCTHPDELICTEADDIS